MGKPHATPKKQSSAMQGQRCGAKTRSGKPCQSWPVAGSKRCRMHGGTVTRNRFGLFKCYQRATYADAIKEHLEEPELQNIRAEIALARVALAGALGGELEADRIVGCCDRIGGLVERLLKIEEGERLVIHIPQLQHIMHLVVDIIAEEITDKAALKRIAQRFKDMPIPDLAAFGKPK